MACSSRAIKICFVVFVIISFILGGGLMSYGSVLLSKVDAYSALSPSVPYNRAPELIISAGSLLMFFSAFSCACQCWETPNEENRCIFIFVSVVFLCGLTLEISGAVCGYKDRDRIKDTLDDDAMKTIRELYGIKTDPTEAVDALQEKGECCGWYNFTDWRDSRFAKEVTVLNDSVVPDSCCVKGPRERFHCGRHFSVDNIYTKGCKGVFLYKLIKDNLYYISVVAIIGIFFQVPGVVYFLVLSFRKEQPEDEGTIFKTRCWREFFED